LLEKTSYHKQDCLIVGDNYLTDIHAGFNSGVDSLLTLTGVNKREDIIDKRQPSYIVNNLDEFEL
ncbi:MAG: HAD hydrolase-like protein, partial [Lactobacillus crispatus]|nr:HAD hydrolase-like protein [Lactobacillus crispatus]